MVVKTVHIGKYEVPLAFTFENELEKFHIIRFICINSKNEIIDDLQPIAPYKKSQKDCSLWQKNCETFNGRPPPKFVITYLENKVCIIACIVAYRCLFVCIIVCVVVHRDAYF